MADETDKGRCAQETSVRSYWEARRPVALLFGRYVAELRTDHRIATDALGDSIGRSQSWVRSVERGEVHVTPPMVENLQLAFQSAVSHHYDLMSAYIDLLDNPHGDLARRMEVGIPVAQLADEPPECPALPDELLPVARSLSVEDRLLVLVPGAILASIAVLCLVVLASIKNWGDVLPGLPVFLLVAAALGAALAAIALPAQIIMRFVSGVLVLGQNRKKLNDLRKWAEDYGLPLSRHGRWHQPGFAPFLMPEYARTASDVGLAADFALRVGVAFGSAGSIAGLAALYAGASPENRVASLEVSDYSPTTFVVLIAGASLFFAVMSWIAAWDWGRRAHGTIRDGLGFIRPELGPEPQEKKRRQGRGESLTRMFPGG